MKGEQSMDVQGENISTFTLTISQVNDCARHLAKNVETIANFFKDPENMKRYREWHIRKYGYEPQEVRQ